MGLVVFLVIVTYVGVYFLLLRFGRASDRLTERIRMISNNNDITVAVGNGTHLAQDVKDTVKNSFMKRIKYVAVRVNSGNQSERRRVYLNKIAVKLYRANINMSAEEFIVIRWLGVGVFFCIAFITAKIMKPEGQMLIIHYIVTMAEPFLISYYAIKGRTQKRKVSMEKELPDVLDLMSISVEAGMGFDQSLEYLTTVIGGPLGDELKTTVKEMTLGKSRAEALHALADRSGIDELQSFANAITQAAQMGISMKSVLKMQSQAMREARRNKVREKAAKVSTKMLIPMVAFIFPVMFIVLLGPAVISIMEQGLLG